MRGQIEARLAALEAELTQGQEESAGLDQYLALLGLEAERVQAAQSQLGRRLDMLYGAIETLQAFLAETPLP